jgi:hypothetical protein
MQENSFEWFSAQIESVRHHVDLTWPEWMKNTSDVATASFPVVGSAGNQESQSGKHCHTTATVGGGELEV